jgi:hypothetical protein
MSGETFSDELAVGGHGPEVALADHVAEADVEVMFETTVDAFHGEPEAARRLRRKFHTVFGAFSKVPAALQVYFNLSDVGEVVDLRVEGGSTP